MLVKDALMAHTCVGKLGHLSIRLTAKALHETSLFIPSTTDLQRKPIQILVAYQMHTKSSFAKCNPFCFMHQLFKDTSTTTSSFSRLHSVRCRVP